MHKKTAVLAVCLVGLIGLWSSCAAPEIIEVTDHPTTDAYEGWNLGVQAYTFRMFTFFEAVDNSASMGLDWIEGFPGQQVSEDIDAGFGHTMDPETRYQVKAKLADAGVRLRAYGVVGLPADTVECRKVFDFAKEMGIETIVSEPSEDALDLIEMLCEEYQIKVAIHNHARPSYYWNPDKVLEVCKGRSKLIGACGDTGHWMRSGLNPIESLKKLQGRLVHMHLKDLNEYGVPREADEGGDDDDEDRLHDVPWGTGKADIKAILAELDRQNYQGGFSAEYEYNWENNLPEVRQCMVNFNEMALELNPSGWHDLFAAELSNATFGGENGWTLEDGLLTLNEGGGNIWTTEQYGDFQLDLEFKLAENTNSGVFIRTGDIQRYVQSSIEVQIHETSDGTNHGACGAIYDCLSPRLNMTRETGEWNQYTITCDKNKIYIVLNGVQIIDMDVDLWTEPGQNAPIITRRQGSRGAPATMDTLITPNKFRTAIKDMPRVGHIGLQDHGQPIWFRNLKIKSLGS